MATTDVRRQCGPAMSWAAGKKTPKPERINQTTRGFLGIL
jgi:hypothetical protein